MNFTERLQAFAMALLLPFLAVGTLYFFTIASVDFGASDRAIVWAEGSPSELAIVETKLRENPWFGAARVRLPSEQLALPDGCTPAAREFSLGNLRMEESQAARSVIESTAGDAGASVCDTNLFIINDLPEQAFALDLRSLTRNLLQAAIIPGAITLAIFLALAPSLGLKLSGENPSIKAAHVAWGVSAALAWILASLPMAMALRAHGLLEAESAPLTFAGLGASWVVAIVLVEPFVRELAFRAWMIPLAERLIGTWPAAMSSAVAYAALTLPMTPGDGVLALGLGGVLCVLYVRTRSLLACTTAGVTVSLGAFVPI